MMFFRRCSRCSVGRLLLILLGFRAITRKNWNDEERDQYREKARTFRKKMREAFSVWDEEDNEKEDTPEV